MRIKIEIRNDFVLIKGYVNAVARDSRTLPSPQGQFVEQVRPGVWQRAIEKNDDISMLLNHDYNRNLGSTKDNLKLSEDSIGLFAEARVYDADVIAKAKNNELVGWSFGFSANQQSWGKTDDNIDRRYLDDINLYEVSILDNSRTPAYYGTSIQESRDNEDIHIEQRFTKEEIEVVNLVDNTEEIRQQEEQKELELRIRLMKIELEL